MPVTRNGYYNDPNIGAAIQNLGQLFAPPSAQDMYLAAKTAETRQNVGSLGNFYNQVNDPNTPLDVIDRGGQAMGLWTPNQSHRAVDIDARTKLQDRSMQESGALARQFAEPIILGEGQTAVLPQQTQKATGLGAMFTGGVKLNEGDQFTLPTMQAGGAAPGNPVLKGAPKTPSGSDVWSYATPDGKGGGTAIYDPTVQAVIDTQTRQPIPEGSFKVNPQGSARDVGLGATTANSTASNSLAANLDALDADIAAAQQLLQQNPGVAGLPGDIRGAAQNIVSVVNEMSQAFGNIAPEANLSFDQVRQAATALAPNRDPAIQQWKLMQAQLAYRVAQMNNPTGEVSRQAYERSLESIAGGLLSNNQTAMEGLTALAEQSKRNRIQVERLRNPQAVTPPQPGAPQTTLPPERWERGPDGNLRKVQ